MSGTILEVANLLEILPEEEQSFALEFVKKLVLAWDANYTKVTPIEKARLEKAEEEKETISHDSINWD